MYHQRFGLKRRPFPATPDTSLYYPAGAHEGVLAPLLQAIADNEGLALVNGEPGTGKTLLGQVLIERLGGDVTTALITNTHFADRAGLLQAILYDLGQPYDAAGEQGLRLRLTDFLLKNWALGKRTVLIVDEAHHLNVDHLEELRLLGNLEAGQGKAFQVVLLAQPGFAEKLHQPPLASFHQRLAVRTRLAHLGVEESLDYLVHHLRLAGGHPEKIMDEAALEVIARGTQGVPRLLNQAAHQALLLADEAELAHVDAEAALEALALLDLNEGPEFPAADSTAMQPTEEDAGVHLIDENRLVLGVADQEPVPQESPDVRRLA